MKHLYCVILGESGTTFPRITFHHGFCLAWQPTHFSWELEGRSEAASILFLYSESLCRAWGPGAAPTPEIYMQTGLPWWCGTIALLKEPWLPAKFPPFSLTPWSGAYFTLWWRATNYHLWEDPPMFNGSFVSSERPKGSNSSLQVPV